MPSKDTKIPWWNEDDARWYSLPETTTVTDKWTLLVLDNGYKILTFGDSYYAGAEVHVLDSENKEVAMWDCKEWEDAPEEVMGAVLRAAGGA